MRLIPTCALLAALLCGGCLVMVGAPQQKKQPAAPSKTKSKTTAAKRTSRTPAAAPKSTAGRRASTVRSRRTASYSRGRSRGPKPVARRRSYGQQRPSNERFLEIQRALAAKGFFEGEPNGVWDASSAAAMKRFQQEQNLPATGKLTSLSLIALGLGPKRNVSETAQGSTTP